MNSKIDDDSGETCFWIIRALSQLALQDGQNGWRHGIKIRYLLK